MKLKIHRHKFQWQPGGNPVKWSSCITLNQQQQAAEIFHYSSLHNFYMLVVKLFYLNVATMSHIKCFILFKCRTNPSIKVGRDKKCKHAPLQLTENNTKTKK